MTATQADALQPARHGDTRTLMLLQALRALAALAVVIQHARNEASLYLGAAAIPPTQIFPWMVAVDVFFVISGFIIVLSSRKLFAAPGGFRTFAERRLIRVLPLYWFTTTLFLVVLLAVPGVLNSPPPDGKQILASYFFFPMARADGIVQPVFGVGWTLNYEMLFYTLFACVIWLPQRVAVLCMAASISALVWAGAAFGPLPEPFGFWARPLSLDFVFGMGLGLLYARGWRIPPLPAIAGAIFAVAVMAWDLPHRPEAATFGALGQIVGWGLPATLLVAMAAFGETDRLGQAVARGAQLWRQPVAGSVRVLAVLGDASYALYLFHPFVLRALRQTVVMTGLTAHVGLVLFTALAVVGSSLVGWLVYRFAEAPTLDWLRRKVRA